VTLERRRPLPEGRYWLDVTEQLRPKWELWRNAMASVPTVTIDHTEDIPPVDEGLFGPHAPGRQFVIFSLSSPNVAWEAVGLPSPTIAGANVQTASDTADMPAPTPDLFDEVSGAATGLVGEVKAGAKLGLGLAGGAAAVAIIILALRR
jgi:hypothetical protein